MCCCGRAGSQPQLQIFDELRKVGKRHEFSAGLLIGGKDVKEEQSRVAGESGPCGVPVAAGRCVAGQVAEVACLQRSRTGAAVKDEARGAAVLGAGLVKR